MRTLSRLFSSLLLAAALLSPVVAITGCAANAGYRVYDPYYNDYHVWDNNEVTYYGTWETQTHRDHKDFSKRSDDEKKEYFTWRHSQNNNK